ncbi:SET and MYND domain-containing protein 3 [Tetrabaena socialis]|uniref:SET and MYND domain-containing protein 3 n=1 Tax=Tetrabaena socialis TaxID=47790 RepID=A0A2J7ZPV5_9CHLO|nr:SET and MYND domain-containing protein 3 [Tetrabaena socialis]|eukprot:PNH02304.1 SET and MYND domain-containing protein 3 [Tetrabaena socialis]
MDRKFDALFLMLGGMDRKFDALVLLLGPSKPPPAAGRRERETETPGSSPAEPHLSSEFDALTSKVDSVATTSCHKTWSPPNPPSPLRASKSAREILSPPDLLRSAVLAAATAAAFRAACSTALRRWQHQRLREPAPHAPHATHATQAPHASHGAHGSLASGRTAVDVEATAAAAAGGSSPAAGVAGGGSSGQQQAGHGRSDGQARTCQPAPAQPSAREEEEAGEGAGARRAREAGVARRRRIGWVPSDGRPPPEVSAAAVFWMLCRIRVNGVAVRPDMTYGSYDRVALGLYPAAAALNHSCVPNLSISFRGLQLVARTAQPVPPGAQLTICYGPQAGKAPRQQRRQQLQRPPPPPTPCPPALSGRGRDPRYCSTAVGSCPAAAAAAVIAASHTAAAAAPPPPPPPGGSPTTGRRGEPIGGPTDPKETPETPPITDADAAVAAAAAAAAALGGPPGWSLSRMLAGPAEAEGGRLPPPPLEAGA